MVRLYAAVDIGATNVRVASGDEEGLKEKVSERTDRGHGAEGVPAQIIRMIRSLEIEGLVSIGVGSIGPIDICTGSIVDTPNFPFKTIPVLEPLTFEFHVPVRMLNDCSAAVLGEQRFGAGKGLRNLAYVTLSTGLGGGAIVDGHLLVGKDGNAVEIGHLTIDPDSSLVCGCGCRGHWEAYSSGSNIPNFARLLLEGEKGDSLLLGKAGGDPSGITAEALFDAAKRGDPTAKYIVSRIGEVNAIGFADIVNAFDPELITVGGSIALNNPDLILQPILENIDRHLINRRPDIEITPLGEDAVLYGALALAMQGGDQSR
ncbi:MAG: ROK family protein [Candidatus Bathyarchaeota archaeon]|nr:ROK family protein [Candidatus Bathyarchaeota archaeon]